MHDIKMWPRFWKVTIEPRYIFKIPILKGVFFNAREQKSPSKRADLHIRNIADYTLTFMFVSVNVRDLLLIEKKKENVGKN